VLDAEPANPDALYMLGNVAIKIGEYAKAEEYFTASLETGKASAEASREQARNLARQNAIQLVGAREKHYLLVKSWGQGFWSDVSHVLGGLLLAEISGRIPIIHWGRNCLFGDGNDSDAFTRFFEPVSGAALSDVATLPDADFYPKKWNRNNLATEDNAKWIGDGARLAEIYFLNRPETVAVADFYLSVPNLVPWVPPSHLVAGLPPEKVFRYLIEKYLRPAPAILAACDAFHAERLACSPYVSIHLRGSDKIREGPNLLRRNMEILSVLDNLPPSLRIFLMTDDQRYIEAMLQRYGDRVVAADCQRVVSDTGVHFISANDPFLMGLEVMRDTYLALRGDHFIGNGYSNVSGMVALMRNWPVGRCILVYPSVLTRRSAVMYLPPEIARYGTV